MPLARDLNGDDHNETTTRAGGVDQDGARTAPALPRPVVARSTHLAMTDVDVDLRNRLTGVGMGVTYWAQVQPNRPALLGPHGSRTFAELNARANQLVRALRRRRLAPGDSVALLCSNRPELAEAWAACLRAGWLLTPINFHLTAAEAAYIIEDCEARALLADARFADVARGAVSAAERAEAPNASVAVRLAIGGVIAGFESYDDALADEDGSDIDDPQLGSLMLYTSGTTGRPKGVTRSRPEPPASDPAAQTADDLHLCTGPLYHAAPLAISLIAPLSTGMGVVLMDDWDAAETLRLIAAHRITHTHMVPTMFHRLLALPPDVRAAADVSSLKAVIHGAAPCPVNVKRAIIEWFGPVVYEYYAATEGAGTLVTSETWLRHPGTVGRPKPADQVKVGDAEGRPLAVGDVGLVWLKAPEDNRFRYRGDDAKTRRAYAGDYFTLGDLGFIDADGYLYLTDRDANLIITGGVNVYPAEVDAVLLDHPSVADAAVIGVPDEEWGERVLAVVQPKADAEASAALADELIEHCRGRLARFKCPRQVDFVTELPRQDNGKIYKRLLRDRYRSA